MLYEENPKFLSEVLSSLLGETFSGIIGVQFAQQRRGKQSVPDGEITQEPFAIFIETKLGSNFGKNQLLGHLETLKQKQGQKVLLALGNFENNIPSHSDFPEIESTAKSYEVAFAAISFEQFLQAIQLPYLPKNLVDAVSDLNQYFDQNNLLPSWKYRLDVVNCKNTFDSVLQHKIYRCPAQGGQYNHQRSLFFGAYRDKGVKQIAKIEAVVDIESQDEANLLWSNDNGLEIKLIKEIALERLQKTGDSYYPRRVFVLGNLFPTDFKKASSGGMQSSKRYFDIRKLKVVDAEGLAEKLRGKTWENYESSIIS